MVEKINGLGKVGNHANRWASFKLSRISLHTLAIPSRNISAHFEIKEADIHKSLSRIQNMSVGAPPRQLQFDDFGDKLYLNVSRISEQELNLELTHIDHLSRWNMHARPFGTYKILGERFNKAGLKTEFKFEGTGWIEINMTESFSLRQYAALTEKGLTYSIRVKGGIAEQRQMALLDILLAIRAEEECDIRIERELKAKEVKTPWVPPENFQNIVVMPENRVIVRQCEMTDFDKGDKRAITGIPETWTFYKDLEKVKSHFGERKITEAELTKAYTDIDNIIKDIIKDLSTGDKANWTKFQDIFDVVKKNIQARISEGMISADLLEQVIFEQRDALFKNPNIKKSLFAQELAKKWKADVEAFMNYLSKSLLEEKMENTISGTDMPVILLTCSLTPSEAKKMPPNVNLVLATDMDKTAHAALLLNEKGIPLYIVKDDVAKFIKQAGGNDHKDQLAVAILADRKLWLNVGLPENVYRHLMFVQRIEEAEQVRDLALNGGIREIHNGDKFYVMVNVNDIAIAKKNFKTFMPNGIGLTRIEMLMMEQQWSTEQLRDNIIELCDIATIEIDGLENPLPVTIRLLDVGIGRDDKNPVWVKNPDNLRGAEWLLSADGVESLKSELRAALLAHLERRDQIRVMIPYIKSVKEFNAIKKILADVKGEILLEIEAEVKVDPKHKYAGITRESLRKFLGINIENKNAIQEIDGLIDEAYFCSLGLNDLRHSYAKETILYPEFVKIIDKVVCQAKKSSTPVSVCGKILNNNELIMLKALGIRTESVDFEEIPKISSIGRSLNQKELDNIKEKLLMADSHEKIMEILEAGQRNMDEWRKKEAQSMSAKGYYQQLQAEQLRFSKIHDIKVKTYANIMQIIRGSEEEKVEIIHDLLEETFKEAHKRFVEVPSKGDISNWLQDEMLIISFLDEWVIREVLNIKSRCTSYILYRSPKDGSYWMNAVNRGGVTGNMSRYYVEFLGLEHSQKNQKGKTKNHLVKVNYFNPQDKTTTQATCVLEIDPDYSEPDHYRVVVPLGNGEEEVIHLLSKKENGKRVFYRRISGEKLLMAKVFNEQFEIPAHSAIYKTPVNRGAIPTLFIGDRKRLSEIQYLKENIDDLEKSIMRDEQNTFYHSKGQAKNRDNVNQLLFFKMRDMPDNRSHIIAVDNWLGNMKNEFQPLISDPTHLVGVARFLGVEMKESEIILSQLDEIKALYQTVNIQKKQLEEYALIAQEKERTK